MDRPRISILVPVHNAARWLRPCLESALAQTYAPIELLAWDDGSADDSRAILASFGDRIRWQSGSKRGGNFARNQLLREARGEWLQFLDADDYLEPQKITRQFEEAGDHTRADMIYSPVWVETWRNDTRVDRVASSLDASTDLFTQWITWQLPQTGGALWRADALRRIGGWNEAMPCCQEHELYLRALQAGLRWVHCPSPGAVYRIWSEQTVCRRDPGLVIRQRTMLIDGALAWLKAQGALRSVHRTAAAQACFEMARTLARFDLDRAVDYYRQRRAHDLILARGPAAPLSYRLVHGAAGFRRAERLARVLRRSNA